MNILQILKQLRDDLKAWATNNFNALNAKIDEKTIPIDSELDQTSTNPVQNKAIATEVADINKRVGNTSVATQISNAIAKQPHFSGDYNDLTNAPNISEDGAGNMLIADEPGNIIFKADADGIHTTALSLNGENAATEAYVDNAIAAIPTPDVSGQIEAHNTSEIAHADIRQAIDEAKTELSESIVAESEEWKVVDGSGNIIFSVDASGAHTTELTLNGENAATEQWVENKNYLTEHQDISGKSDVGHKHVMVDLTDLPDYATKDYVDTSVADLVNSAPEALDTLGELAIALDNHEDAYDALLETVGGKATFDDLENMKTELSESIVSEQQEFHVVDNNGHVVTSIDGNGVATTSVVAQSMVVNGDDVEEHIDNTNIHVTSAEKAAWNNKSNFSGSYNDLTDKPVPTDLSDYYTKSEVDTAIENVEVDLSGYATEEYVNNAIDGIDFPETDLSNYYTKTETDTAIESAKEEISESIVSESEEWHIVDNNGNIVTTIDEGGVSTTTVSAQAVTINGTDIEDLIAERVQLIGDALDDIVSIDEIDAMCAGESAIYDANEVAF